MASSVDPSTGEGPPLSSTFPRVPKYQQVPQQRTPENRPSSHPRSQYPSQARSPLRNYSISVAQTEDSVLRQSTGPGRARADSAILPASFSLRVLPEDTVPQDLSLRRDSALSQTTALPTGGRSPRQQRTPPTRSPPTRSPVESPRLRAASTTPGGGRDSPRATSNLPPNKRLPTPPTEHPTQLTGKWTSLTGQESRAYIYTEPTWRPLTSMPSPPPYIAECKPIMHPVKGVCPHYPRTLNDLLSLDEIQLDQLARHYDQVYVTTRYTDYFPKKMIPWIGAPGQRDVDIDTKRRRFADFIGVELPTRRPARNSLSESMKKELPPIPPYRYQAPGSSLDSFNSADMRNYGFREKMKVFPKSGKSKMAEIYDSVLASRPAWQRPRWVSRQLFQSGEK